MLRPRLENIYITTTSVPGTERVINRMFVFVVPGSNHNLNVMVLVSQDISTRHKQVMLFLLSPAHNAL